MRTGVIHHAPGTATRAFQGVINHARTNYSHYKLFYFFSRFTWNDEQVFLKA
jgi:hypothetical protein